MKLVKLYDQTITRAHYANETGTTLSITPWTGDTDRIQGYSADSDRVLELNDAVEVYEGSYGDIIFTLDDQSYINNEIIISQGPGRIVDARFGHVRDLKTKEHPKTAAALAGIEQPA